MSWVSPTGFNDPDGVWTDEPKAYDEDTGTFAFCNAPPNDWCKFLELTIAEITSDKLRIYAGDPFGLFDNDIDVFKDGAWVHVFLGRLSPLTWHTKTFAEGQVTKMRFRRMGGFMGGVVQLYEADFWEIPTGLKKVIRLNFPLCAALEAMNVAKGDKVLKVNEGVGVVLVAKNALKGDIVLVL